MVAAHASRKVIRLRGAPHQKAPRFLVGLELTTGATGLVGGLLLAMRPDGSLLNADLRVLADSPFPDWRLPGLLLACLVGGGFLLAGGWQWRGRRGAAWLSMLAGLGLVVFEAAELSWLGFQPLAAVFAVVGLAVVVLPGVQVCTTDGAADSDSRRRRRRHCQPVRAVAKP